MSVLYLFEERLATPLGELIILTDELAHTRAVDWIDYEARLHELLRRQYPHHPVSIQPAVTQSQALQALTNYFAGDLHAIHAVPCQLGGTVFQQQVWDALQTIPCGSTWSYAQLAQHIQRPKAVRAVGTANGANPISIIIPCHRVIGNDQGLTGYAGGLERKRWLLQHEGALVKS